MNTAEWILVAILSVTLFIFLLTGIILLVKLIHLTEDASRVVQRGQDIADNANGIVQNVKGMTSIGGVVQTFVDKYVEPKLNKERSKNGDRTEDRRETE